MNRDVLAAISRMSQEPWAIAPQSVAAALASLAAMGDDQDYSLDLAAVYGVEAESGGKAFAFDRANGVAVIPVRGVLLNRYNYAYSGATGYQAVLAMFQAAEADPEVRGIVYDHNSPGGDAQGCFELSAELAAGKKPSVAIVDANSYSASFALAVSADRIVVTPSGGVGSVGVYTTHVDVSKYLEMVGMKVTPIFSGDHKVDGNPFEPLPEDVRKDMQTRVDQRRQQFAEVVAAGRGMTVEAVLATEARCYSAQDAVAVGFADVVQSPRDAYAAFVAGLSQAASAPFVLSEAPMPQTDDSRAAERARIKAIRGHEAAASHPELADHLALETDLTAEQAAGILAAAAKDKPAAPAPAPQANAFLDAMRGSGSGVDPNTPEKPAELSVAQQALAAFTLATGRAVK